MVTATSNELLVNYLFCVLHKSVNIVFDPIVMPKFYAVRAGLVPGVYESWAACSAQVTGFSGAVFKSFATRRDAEEFAACAPPAVAEPQPETPRTGPQVVYTDGSALGNGKAHAVAGVGVWFGVRDSRNVSERLPGKRQTNQRAEIYAAVRALEVLLEEGDPRVELRTDSMYLVNAMTDWIHRWRKTKYRGVQNSDLFERLDSLVFRCDMVKWVRVLAQVLFYIC